jgi:hypothetical protein
MSNSYEQAFQDFKALLSKWKGAHVCSVHSYVALKGQEGGRLLFGRVLLEPTREGINETPFKFQTEHIIAGRFVKVATLAETTSGLVEKAMAGQMDAGDGIASLVTDASNPIRAYFAPIYHPLIAEGPRLPSLILHGVAKHNLLVTTGDSRQLDWEMKAADIPFDSLDELLGHCGLPTLMQIGDSTALEIVARSPGAIGGGSTISDREAVIECRVARELDASKLRLGYRLFQKDQKVDRGSVTGDIFGWHEEADLKLGSHRVAVGEAPLIQAFLSYDGISLHQAWITDPKKHLNPRHAVHQVFDEDLQVLKKLLLKPELDKEYVFEGAISTLLTLLGFSVSNYGRIPKLQKGPDIIAIAPSGHIGVVECTLGILSANDKLAKLVQRTKLITEKLAEAGYGQLQIQPVIVTSLPKDEVTADLATAGEHGIAVVCRENLEGALNQVSLPPHADQIFQDAKKLVPSSQPSLFKQ